MPSISSTVNPENSETSIVLDSTRGLMNSQASISTSAAQMAPGSFRGKWPRAVASVTIKCTTQNLTAKFEILTGSAGTSADWEEQGALGSQTVTAGTTFTYEFKPLAADWRIRVLAGADNPDATDVKVDFMTHVSDYGN